MTLIFDRMSQHTTRVIAAVVALTAVLAIPFITMSPDESASTEPGGDVFDARDLVDERFVSSVHFIGFMAEHESGDLLRAEPLAELLDAQQRLRDDPEIGPTLFSYFDVDVQRQVDGVFSIANLIDDELRRTESIGVAGATDTQVRAAAATVIDRFGVASDELSLSQQTTRDAAGNWISPAIFIRTTSDDTILGFGNTSINLGGDTDVEEYDRDVQQVLRTAEGWDVFGIAIDVNLTSQEQGAVAGPFIGFTVLAALLIVGLVFRSYWVMATVSIAFLMLIVWLKGITNLIGFEDDLVLALIVPIAMVSFGVDYAFHAIGRYREERAGGKTAAPAAIAGAAAVSGALVLATMSDSVAFLANVTAGIESIVQFGIGAAIALFSAFVLLGIVAPMVVAWIEAQVPPPTPGRRSAVLRVLASIGAAMMAMASVLLLVFVLPEGGLVLAVATAVLTLAIPVQRRRRRLDGPAVGDLPVHATASNLSERVGRAVLELARRRAAVLSAAVMATALAAVFALQVPARFDVEDFFSADTDFVRSLDLIDEHVGDRNGEPATFYIEGDLSDPANLARLQGRIAEIRAIESDAFSRDDGGVKVESGLFDLFDHTFSSSLMPELVWQSAGVVLTDVDGDSIPDSRGQIEALVEVASQTGVPFDESRLAMTPDDVNTAVDLEGDRDDATVLWLQIVNSRDQASVTEAQAALEPIADAISSDLGGSFVQATGSAFVREESLEATNRALVVSLPIAVLACLVVATTFLRSFRYGLASIVPILMVVAWLYAFMEVAGYAINLVTATIAAVSIGIGIDFALHYISRYREELARWGHRESAVRIAAEGTGMALVASAVSSAVGFGILAFAPMPLFAAYGLLTAIMIMMALVATLVVLPSLLVLISRDREDDLFDAEPTGWVDVAELQALEREPVGAH